MMADVRRLADAGARFDEAVTNCHRSVTRRVSQCAYCWNPVRHTIDHRCYGCGAPWPVSPYPQEPANRIVSEGWFTRNEVRRRNPGVTYFGCYTALNDHEYFIPLQTLKAVEREWMSDDPITIAAHVEPGALARAIERLRARG